MFKERTCSGQSRREGGHHPGPLEKRVPGRAAELLYFYQGLPGGTIIVDEPMFPITERGLIPSYVQGVLIYDWGKEM